MKALVDVAKTLVGCALLVSLVAMPAGSFYFFLKRLPPKEHSVSALVAACPSGPIADAQVSLMVRVSNDNLNSPRLMTNLSIDLPMNSYSRQLFESDHQSGYKSTVRCILGRENGWFYSEERRRPFSVSIRSDRITFESVVEVDIPPSANELHCGPLKLVRRQPGLWTIHVERPNALALAKWHSVKFEAPARWLGNPYVWPPQESDETHITWAPLTLIPPSGILVDLALGHEEYLKENSYSGRNNSAYDFLFAMSLFSAAIVAYVFIVNSTRSQIVTGMSLIRRQSRVLGGVAVIVIAGVNAHLVTQFIPAVQNLSAAHTVLKDALIAAVCSTILCIGLRKSRVVSLLVGTLVAIVITYALRGYAENSDGTILAIGISPISWIAWKMAVVTALLLVASFGSLAIIRSTLFLGIVNLNPLPVWVAAGIATLLLLSDRVLVNFLDAKRIYALHPVPIHADSLCCAFDWFPGQISVQLEFVATTVLAVLVWHICQASYHLGVADRKLLVRASALILVLVVLSRHFWVIGWAIPVTPALGLLAYWSLSKCGSPLDCIGPNGVSMRDRMSGSEWSRIRDRYHSGAAVLALGPSIPPLPDRMVDVDILLAVGPNQSPIANAKIAAKIAVMIGTPLGLAFQVFRSWKVWNISSYQSEFIGQIIFRILPEMATWLGAGVVLGLLWQYLPGRRGMAKSAVLVGLYSLPLGVNLVGDVISYPADFAFDLVAIVLFSIVMMLTGIAIDYRTLRPNDTRSVKFLLQAYGVRDLAGQGTFLLAQVAAILAIISFLRGQGDAPSYPSIDPFQSSRP
ncbi:DUF6185 family protein [Nocardia sp. NPDC057227]|uniref:DUF6185 family protein n=1 Tax=Nocardia sp. NPDC057227 TaxID=3346056 RepID=UPI003634661E